MGSRRICFWRRGFRPLEREVLGFVTLDSVEEGVVVRRASAGNLPQEKTNVSGGGERSSLGGVLRCVRGVVALDGSPGRRLGRRTGWKMQRHSSFHFQRRAELDGGSCSIRGGPLHSGRQTPPREQRPDARPPPRPVP